MHLDCWRRKPDMHWESVQTPHRKASVVKQEIEPILAVR